MTDDLGLADEEKVARAICRAFCKLHKTAAGWDLLTTAEQDLEIDLQWDLWTNEAQAAIAALRSPRAVPANGAGREAIAETIQQFWQGASGRPWDGCDDSCCVKLPAQADWFRKLADAILALASSPVVGPSTLPRPNHSSPVGEEK